jgi:TrpR family trp operon transcriptional repressor
MKTTKEKKEQYKKEVLNVIADIAKDKNLLVDFMCDIHTPRELENMGTRWQVIKRLAKGQVHQQIAGELGLGVGTVTRGSREMRKSEGGFRRALKLLGISVKS